MDIDDFVSYVEVLRKVQEEYLQYPFPDLLRKKKRIENKIDREINKYYEEKKAEEQMKLLFDDY